MDVSHDIVRYANVGCVPPPFDDATLLFADGVVQRELETEGEKRAQRQHERPMAYKTEWSSNLARSQRGIFSRSWAEPVCVEHGGQLRALVTWPLNCHLSCVNHVAQEPQSVGYHGRPLKRVQARLAGILGRKTEDNVRC